MKKSTLLIAVFALAACSGGEADEAQTAQANTGAGVEGIDPNAQAGFEAVAPGNYEIVRGDGSIDQLTVSPGMIWSMVSSNGQASGGTIFAQGGKNCFVTEGVEGHRCFEGSEPEADGSMKVTGEDGEEATVRPVDSFR